MVSSSFAGWIFLFSVLYSAALLFGMVFFVSGSLSRPWLFS